MIALNNTLPQYVIIDKSNHSIIHKYFATQINLTEPGSKYNQSQLVHLQVPLEFHANPFIKAVKYNDTYTFEIDSTLITKLNEQLINNLRQERNTKLKECDWIVSVSDTIISPELKQQWIEYRQALRDFPKLIIDPMKPNWPIPPNK